MKTLTSLAAALALALPAMTVQAQEVAGVRFGMSIAEAKKAVLAFNKDLEITPLIDDNKTEVGFSAAMTREVDEDYERVQVFKGGAKGVYFVNRIRKLPPKEAFSPKLLEDGLLKKYGKASVTDKYAMLWQFGRDGRLYPGSTSWQYFGGHTGKTPCAELGYENWNHEGGMRLGEFNNLDFRIPKNANSTCKAVYHAGAPHEANGLVRYFYETIADYATLYDFLVEKETREKAEQDRQRQQQLDKGLKPKL